MNFKRVYTSTKTYVILLIAALALLLFTASMAYKQILRMQESAEMVTHTLQVYNVIGNLSEHYTKADSEAFKKELLKDKTSSNTLENYKKQGQTIMDSLTVLTIDNKLQQTRLKPLQALLKKMYGQLSILDTLNIENDQTYYEARELQKSKIGTTLYNIRILKNQVLAEEKVLMRKRKADYDSYKFLAPLTSLILAFLALFISFFTFLRIYRNKQKIRESEAFLQSILATTDNIVNYYVPIFDDINNIIDFRINFANECNRDYLGLEPDKIVGKTIREVFPFFLMNGEFEDLVKSFTKKEKVLQDQQSVVKGENIWFQFIIVPLAEGILITGRNTTAEEESKAVQLAFKKRLEHQNLELLDNRAFLGNIFKSISHIVMHFKSIRDKKGKIIDFEILFVNDKINPVTGDIPSEIKNKKISLVFPSIFENGVFEHLVNAIEHNIPVDYEVAYYKNNYEQWFSATAIKLGDGVTITTIDITEEKKNSDQLLKLNQDLNIKNSILSDAENLAKTGSFIWYIEDENIELSYSFYNMLGCKLDDYITTPLSYREFIHPEDLGIYDEKIEEALTNALSKEHTYRVITKQGETKHFKINGQFVDKNGKNVLIGVAQDITEIIEFEASLKQYNEELKFQNTVLNDAEALGDMGSFRINVASMASVLSQNIYKMLDCAPNAFEATPEAYLPFVHPEDLDFYIYNVEKTFKTKTFESFIYRVKTEKGIIKYFKSTGHFDTYLGEEYLLGLVQDVTEDIKAKEFLKLKNQELLRSNNELESFNRVASHDLQEPLRKIQLFISRIEDREGDQFSDKGRFYFEKVTNAVIRMQSLIKNLLAYSRIDSSKTDFETIDLNDIFDKVNDDLAIRIKETNAKVTADKLPKITGVVYQMEQLFTNLISNALKYKNTEDKPKLEVSYKKVNASKLPDDVIKLKKQYHKITFTDNGIGFDDKYAEKIFEVFQRLHQKTEYTGNGIGLAICKKITENHNGYMHAKGTPGKGAKFIVYLPA